jgi:hypothetical protein
VVAFFFEFVVVSVEGETRSFVLVIVVVAVEDDQEFRLACEGDRCGERRLFRCRWVRCR